MVLTQIMIRVFSRLEISTEYQFWYCDVDIHRWILLHHYWCQLLIHVSLPIYIPVQPRSQPLTYQLHASSNKHTDVFWTWRIHGFSRGVCSGGFSPHATLDRIPEADLASKIPREVGIGNINAKMAGICNLKTAGRKQYSYRRSCAPQEAFVPENHITTIDILQWLSESSH